MSYYKKTEEENILYKYQYNSFYKRNNGIVLYLRCTTKGCKGRAEIELLNDSDEVDVEKLKFQLNVKILRSIDRIYSFYYGKN